MAATLHVRTAARRGGGPDGAAAWLAGAAVALTLVLPMAVLSSPGPADAAAAATPPAGRWELTAVQPAVPAATASAPDQPSTAETGQARVWRERHTIVVAARQASRAEVARQLAALTGVDPQRPADLLRAAHPLTLHWRGTDAAEAWRQVLGVHADHAVQCDAGRCRLWLVEPPGTPAQAAGAAGAMRDAVTADHPPEGGAPAPAEASDDAEQAPAPWESQQPDPPGLFPAD